MNRVAASTAAALLLMAVPAVPARAQTAPHAGATPTSLARNAGPAPTDPAAALAAPLAPILPGVWAEAPHSGAPTREIARADRNTILRTAVGGAFIGCALGVFMGPEEGSAFGCAMGALAGGGLGALLGSGL